LGNKTLLQNVVSGKSESRSEFSGKAETVRVLWQPPGPPPLGYGFLGLYLRLNKELERGSLFIVVF
jgi:hypothetical protein